MRTRKEIFYVTYCAVGGDNLQLYETRNNRIDCMISENMEFVPHLHKQVEVMVCLQGRCTIRSNFTSYLLEEGDAFIAFPNTVHEYCGGEQNRSMLWIFDSGLLPDFAAIFRKKMTESPVIRKVDLHSDVRFVANQFAERKELWQETPLCKSYLGILLYHTLQQLSLTDLKVSEDLEWMVQVLRYLNDYYEQPLSLDELAQQVGVSKYHLSRTFHARIGCSIPSYLTTLRLDQALGMLRGSDLSVTDIAYACGFESMTTFFRAFRQRGVGSPKNYRKQYRL